MTVKDSGRRRRLRTMSYRRDVELLLSRVVEANDDLTAAKSGRTPTDAATAQYLLQVAVDAVRDAGAEWTQIGNALGIRRGNAYQKFRIRAEITPAATPGLSALISPDVASAFDPVVVGGKGIRSIPGVE